MRSKILTTVLCIAVGIISYWYVTYPRLQGRDEDLFAAIVEMRCAVIKLPPWALLCSFSGSSALEAPEARDRVFRHVRYRYPALEIIDVAGMSVSDLDFKVPGTRRPATLVKIGIVEWHNDAEVVIRCDIADGGLAGGGGEFVMLKKDGVWSTGKVLETFVH